MIHCNYTQKTFQKMATTLSPVPFGPPFNMPESDLASLLPRPTPVSIFRLYLDSQKETVPLTFIFKPELGPL